MQGRKPIKGDYLVFISMSRSHCNYLKCSICTYVPAFTLRYSTGRHLPCLAEILTLVGLSGLSRYKPSTDPPTKWDYCSTRRVQCCFSFFLALRQNFASLTWLKPIASLTWHWVFENFILRHPSYSFILETDTRVSLNIFHRHNIIIAKTFFTQRRKWYLNSISLIGNTWTYFTLLF